MVIIGSLDVGGAEMDIVRNFVSLAKGQEFDITLALYTHQGTLYHRLNGTPVTALSQESTISTGASLGTKIREHWRRFWFVRRAIASIKPDILHPFLPGAYFYACLAHLVTHGRRRFVLSRLSLNFYSKKRPLLSWIERHICHKIGPHHVVGNAHAILDELEDEGFSRNQMTLIHNGIETEHWTTKRSESFYTGAETFHITALGNLHPHKGYDDLLDALAILKKAKLPKPWHVNIAGRDVGSTKHKLTERIKSLDLQDYVTLLGHVTDREILLQKTHLFVHPAHTEGLPNAIIEAMSASLPVVATRVGGVPELIDGANGLLVSPRSPKALAGALSTLLSDPKTMYALGQAGSAKAHAEFNVKRSVQDYKQLYQRLMGTSCQGGTSMKC